jgi:hypothetical protein
LPPHRPPPKKKISRRKSVSFNFNSRLKRPAAGVLEDESRVAGWIALAITAMVALLSRPLLNPKSRLATSDASSRLWKRKEQSKPRRKCHAERDPAAEEKETWRRKQKEARVRVLDRVTLVPMKSVLSQQRRHLFTSSSCPLALSSRLLASSSRFLAP